MRLLWRGGSGVYLCESGGQSGDFAAVDYVELFSGDSVVRCSSVVVMLIEGSDNSGLSKWRLFVSIPNSRMEYRRICSSSSA